MSDPATAVSLPDHCTVINDGVLYVYSPAGFQSLALKDGGQWQDLPMGVSVAGGQCVLAAEPGKTAGSMYVVGGSANSSNSDYMGLQQYDFSAKKWSSIKPLSKDIQDRQNHRTAYLSDSGNIVVYGGSTTDTAPGLSSQTFAVSTQEPYLITSFTSELPLTGAQVISWNSSHAILIGGVAGGDAPNKKVLTFGPEGWANSGTSLKDGLEDSSIMRCSVITGSDGSKVLNAYNAGVSPNTVQSIVLWTDKGEPADPGTYIGTKSSKGKSESRKRKRDLSLSNWPTYSDSNAPTIQRSNFALATDGNGLAVLSGGSSDDAISVFNQQKNTWVDAAKLLGSQEPLVVSSISVAAVPSSTDSSSSITPPTSASEPSATSSDAAGASPPSNNSHTLTVLGATLGTIFGLAAILIIILLCLRYRKDKKRRAAGGYVDEKHNDRLSFADQGTEFMHTAGGSVGHNYSRSMSNSLTSLNIVAGKVKDPRFGGKGHTRRGGSAGSDTSTSALIKPPRSPLGLGDSLEMSQMGSGKAPKLVNIGPQGGRAPPAALTDPPPLSAGAIRSARGQAGRPSSRGTIGSDIRPGSSGSASRGGAVVAGMGRANDAQPSRSSGWSKYFAPSDPASNLGGYAQQPPRKSTDTSASKSLYAGESRGNSNVTYPSQTVQPLELNLGPKFDSTLADGQRLSRVATGSPTFGHSRDHSTNGRDPNLHGQTAQLSRATSGKSTVNSSIGDYSFGSGTVGEGTHTATTWTPMTDRGFNDKPANSSHNHSDSVGSSIYSRNPQSYYPAYDDRRALYGKSGVSTASTVWPVPPKSPLPGEGRDSATLSAFPRTPGNTRPPVPTTVNGQKQYGYGQGPAQQKKVPVTEDVSWLNLGGDSTH